MGVVMRTDLRNHLLAIARGDLSSKSGVTDVTDVTAPSGYVTKPSELRRLQGLRVNNDHLEKDLDNGVTEPVTYGTDLEDAMSERLAMIEEDGVVPVVFRDAWVRLNCARPPGISEVRWWDAIAVGGRLLDSWGDRAAALGWRPADLFGVEMGLVWMLANFPGSVVTCLDETGANISTATGDRRRYRRRWPQ
jgi:hypothetical protein